MKIFTVTGTSESSDHYGPYLYLNKPTKTTLSELAHDLDGDELKEGPGFDGSYIYWTVKSTNVIEN